MWNAIVILQMHILCKLLVIFKSDRLIHKEYYSCHNFQQLCLSIFLSYSFLFSSRFHTMHAVVLGAINSYSISLSNIILSKTNPFIQFFIKTFPVYGLHDHTSLFFVCNMNSVLRTQQYLLHISFGYQGTSHFKICVQYC